MASKTIKVCDFEEDDDADVVADETRQFTWDGEDYEIDLCTSHDIQFRAFLDQAAKWRAAARAVHSAAAPPPPRQRRGDTAARRAENAAVRKFAQSRGHTIGDRGRIPESIRQEYREFLGTEAGRRWSAALQEDDETPEQRAPADQHMPVGA